MRLLVLLCTSAPTAWSSALATSLTPPKTGSTDGLSAGGWRWGVLRTVTLTVTVTIAGWLRIQHSAVCRKAENMAENTTQAGLEVVMKRAL